MSTASSERRALRAKLELALYEYVKEKNGLPTGTELKNKAGTRYIEARKFILAKMENGQFTVEKILAAEGKVVVAADAPPKEEAKEVEEERTESSGNLLRDSVVEATKRVIEEERKKAEDATPSQEATVGPVRVKDDAFDNVDIEVEEKKQKEEALIVTRKALRHMSKNELSRFFDAVDTMLINKTKGVAGTSEFYRLASYHGYPRPIYCQHGRETFPGWHRIYLQQFELALQVADKTNGNDGEISLPYWDWMTSPEDGLHPMIRKRFAKWPNKLFPEDVIPQYKLKRDSDDIIGQKLVSWGTIKAAYDSLLATEHYAHASTGDQLTYPSVEVSHNHLHTIIGGRGGTMSSVAWAAYDIAFWLHHCNVDRIYESYLVTEPDSRDEFEYYQENQSQDLFDIAFTPFKKENGEYYYPRDTFDTRALGYEYEELIKPQPMQLRQAPTLVLFRQVKVFEFESKCYQIHVFVVDKEKEEEFKEPQKATDVDLKSVHYAGGDAIFGRGMECSNCMTRPPVDLYVDISATLRELQLSRYDAVIKVYIEEMTDDSDKILRVSDTPLPEPVVTGPYFEDSEESLNEAESTKCNGNEVASLQRFLQRFGYYDDDRKIDGEYGEITAQAVRDFQIALDLKVDGIAGPQTKAAITHSRRCSNKDGFAKNKSQDLQVGHRYDKNELSYFIDLHPGYLDREAVEECIAAAFKEWNDACSLSFKLLDDNDLNNRYKADIVLRWTKGKSADGRLGFDGAGGILGHGGKGFVEFDIAERWVYGHKDDEELSVLDDTSTWYKGQPTVSLYYVALHEIGHALGLDHSQSSKDLMGPYYSPNIKKLSKNDIDRIQEAYQK